MLATLQCLEYEQPLLYYRLKDLIRESARRPKCNKPEAEIPPEQQQEHERDDKVDDVDEVQEIIQADEELVADAAAVDLAADSFAINFSLLT